MPAPVRPGWGRGGHDKDKASGLSATERCAGAAGGGRGLGRAKDCPRLGCSDLGLSPPPRGTPCHRCSPSPAACSVWAKPDSGLLPPARALTPVPGANVKLLPSPALSSPLHTRGPQGGRQQRLSLASQPLCLSLTWLLLPRCPPRPHPGLPGSPLGWQDPSGAALGRVAAAPKAELAAPSGALGPLCITSNLYTGSLPLFFSIVKTE